MTAVPDLVAVVDRLLAPQGGCVWNRAQTHASLAHYAVEESYELVDAIDDGDDAEVREELGDVLYQVVLHAGIAAAEGRFDLEDVAAGVRDKMVRRHPHVFGAEHADTEEEVVRVWRAAKAAEKAARTSAFDGVPRAMPPLERAVKLLERLEERGDLEAVLAAAGVPAVPEAPARASVVQVPGADDGPAADGPALDGPALDGPALDGAASAGAGAGVGGGGGPVVDGVSAAWGADVLARVAWARTAGIDPVASLRAAVGRLEAAGRAVE